MFVSCPCGVAPKGKFIFLSYRLFLSCNFLFSDTDMLKNTGFLEQGFGSANSYGQQYQAALVRNSTNTDVLQGMVVTQGGIALPSVAMRQIAKAVTPGLGGYTEDNVTVTGAMDMWTMPLSGFGVGTAAGHLAVLLTSNELSAARDDTDRLYRFQVTGKPDLNKMHTSIDMGTNDLNNTGTVNAQTGNFSGNVSAGGTVNAGSDVNAGGGVTAAGNIRSTGGWLVNRGNCWLASDSLVIASARQHPWADVDLMAE